MRGALESSNANGVGVCKMAAEAMTSKFLAGANGWVLKSQSVLFKASISSRFLPVCICIDLSYMYRIARRSCQSDLRVIFSIMSCHLISSHLNLSSSHLISPAAAMFFCAGMGRGAVGVSCFLLPTRPCHTHTQHRQTDRRPTCLPASGLCCLFGRFDPHVCGACRVCLWRP